MALQPVTMGSPVGLLRSIEKGLERAVNGAFAKTFRSGVQPVEIASAIRREIDTNAAVVSRDRIIAPRSYAVHLNPADAEAMSRLGSALVEELHALVSKHARDQGYSFAGPLSITLVDDDAVAAGMIDVAVGDSQTSSRAGVSWQGVIEVDGRRHTLTSARTVIGRGSDAQITITDPGSSRKHVEVLWDGERAMLRDLGSTNGTKIDGHRVREAALPSETVFTIGRTSLVFRVVPVSPSRPTYGDDSTRILGEMP